MSYGTVVYFFIDTLKIRRNIYYLVCILEAYDIICMYSIIVVHLMSWFVDCCEAVRRSLK